MEAEDQDYWNISLNKSFNFDDETNVVLEPKHERLLSPEDEEKSSEISYEISQSEMPIHLIISDEDLKSVLEDQTIDQDSVLPKNITIEDEVKILRRQLQEMNYAPVSLTVSKLLLGKPTNLQIYKSLKEKTMLLDEAIFSGNGDAVLQIVLFIKSTLKKSLFHEILRSRPDAVNHYINFLMTRVKIQEAFEIFMMLGRFQEAALLQFQAAANSSSAVADIKKQRLKKIFSDYFSNSTSMFSTLVANCITLLEMQIVENSLFHPKSVIDESVLKTLYLICGKHKWSESSADSNLLNPYKLSENYQVSAAQFEWVVLNERGKKQAWRDIETLFERKSWYNLKQKSFTIHVPIDKAILRLYDLNAPQPILNKFLSNVDDLQRKLALSKRVGATHSTIDCFVALKDKNDLEVFVNNLENGTAEKFYGENALKNMNSKWKAVIK